MVRNKRPYTNHLRLKLCDKKHIFGKMLSCLKGRSHHHAAACLKADFFQIAKALYTLVKGQIFGVKLAVVMTVGGFMPKQIAVCAGIIKPHSRISAASADPILLLYPAPLVLPRVPPARLSISRSSPHEADLAQEPTLPSPRRLLSIPGNGRKAEKPTISCNPCCAHAKLSIKNAPGPQPGSIFSLMHFSCARRAGGSRSSAKTARPS